jgi:Na+/H+ antiporter NhaB
MLESCPVRGLKFEREQGYFLGAMYVSYLVSIPPVGLLVMLIWKLTGRLTDVSIAAAFLAYLPFVPVVARFARIVWMYIDQAFDPR